MIVEAKFKTKIRSMPTIKLKQRDYTYPGEQYEVEKTRLGVDGQRWLKLAGHGWVKSASCGVTNFNAA